MLCYKRNSRRQRPGWAWKKEDRMIFSHRRGKENAHPKNCKVQQVRNARLICQKLKDLS